LIIFNPAISASYSASLLEQSKANLYEQILTLLGTLFGRKIGLRTQIPIPTPLPQNPYSINRLLPPSAGILPALLPLAVVHQFLATGGMLTV